MNPVTSRLQKTENAVIAICFIVMSLAAFAQVVNRNLVGAGISWFDELARYCMVLMTLLATEAGLRDGTQISITAVTDRCPPVIKRLLQVIVKIVIIAFSSMIFYQSLTLISKQIKSGQVSSGMGVPMWLPYASLPIAFGFIAVAQIVLLVYLIKSPLPSKNKQPSKEGDKA